MMTDSFLLLAEDRRPLWAEIRTFTHAWMILTPKYIVVALCVCVVCSVYPTHLIFVWCMIEDLFKIYFYSTVGKYVGCGGGREVGGGEPERGTILGEPVLRSAGYQLIFPPMWRLARTDQLCRAAVFCKNSGFVGFMALLLSCRGILELQYQPT